MKNLAEAHSLRERWPFSCCRCCCCQRLLWELLLVYLVGKQQKMFSFVKWECTSSLEFAKIVPCSAAQLATEWQSSVVAVFGDTPDLSANSSGVVRLTLSCHWAFSLVAPLAWNTQLAPSSPLWQASRISKGTSPQPHPTHQTFIDLLHHGCCLCVLSCLGYSHILFVW